VGYSDHTQGITAAIAATALGATVIEKHFTLDRELSGPDHKASLEPAELAAMVQAIHDTHAALGDGEKAPSACEQKNLINVRKSLVAATAVKQGETFTAENLACKRPGSGVSPMAYWDFLGTAASRPFNKDEQL
jgi:sialic acid synthase SpsE